MHTKLLTAAGALAIAAATLTGVGIAHAATPQNPAAAQPAVQQLAPRPAVTHGTGLVTVRFTDPSGNPVSGIKFVAYGFDGPTPGGTTRDLTTDSDGRATWALEGYGWTLGTTTVGSDTWPLWSSPRGTGLGEIVIDGDGSSAHQTVAMPGVSILSKSPSFVEIRLP